MKFDFNEACIKAFEFFKERLVSTPIILSPDWSLPFDIICDLSSVDLGVVLGQSREKVLHPVYYTSKALNLS